MKTIYEYDEREIAMAKMSREQVVERLKAAGISFDDTAGYSELLALVPKETKVETAAEEMKKEPESGESKAQPKAPIPEVVCGPVSIEFLNRRLCVVENNLGIANWDV